MAEKAGVSQGALQYYFASKSELVDAALSTQVVDALELVLAPGFAAGSSLERAGEFLDRLWEFHRLPVFATLFELFGLDKRDQHSARQTAVALDVILGRISDAAARAVPERADEATFDLRVRLVTATVRGCAAVDGIPGSNPPADEWPELRSALALILTAGA